MRNAIVNAAVCVLGSADAKPTGCFPGTSPTEMRILNHVAEKLEP